MNTDGEDAGGSFDRVEVYRGDQRRASRSADPDAEHDPAAAALAQGFQDHSAKPSQQQQTWSAHRLGLSAIRSLRRIDVSPILSLSFISRKRQKGSNQFV
jgi:hypothetical protein